MSSELVEKAVEKFENYMAGLMAKAKIPGLSLAVVKDSQIIYARGFGARNLEDNLPATRHTLYGIGSCTKSFTALAIMQLAEQEKLHLDDPVNKYIPFNLGTEDNPITIHNLLTHSSGIPNLGVAELVINRLTGMDEKWIPMSSMDDLILHINGAEAEVAALPSKRFFYFNSGYTLLGEIIGKVSKMKYEEYIKEKILKPLKMKRSTFLKESFEKEHDIMTPYIVEAKEGNVKVTATKHPFHKFIYAPGGLLSSVMELANYLIANMNNGIFEETKIVEVGSLEEMHKSHIESNIPSLFGETLKYGYGWGMLENFFGHKLVRHDGSTGVSSASLAFIPDLRIGVAMACNTGGAPSTSLIPLGVLALLMGKDPEKEFKVLEIDKKLDMLVGEYQSYKGIHGVSVVKKEGLLYVEVKEPLMEMTAPLIPEDEKLENFKFYISVAGVRMPVEFIVDSSGRIDLYYERHRLHKIEGLTPT